MKELERLLRPPLVLWKIHDTTTGGQPDLEVNWHEHVTKIEFKVLRKLEIIHDKWEDARQLVTLRQYEAATSRAWVVAYCLRVPMGGLNRTFHDETIIYRPSALADKRVPTSELLRDQWDPHDAIALWDQGVIGYRGVRHDMVAALIYETHR